MTVIKLSIQSKEKEVAGFLKELKEILLKESFDLEKDLTLIRKEKKKEEEQFSTPYTLLDLDYDTSDVVECLKELVVKEYSETLIDEDDIDPPLLFVGDQSRRILCVSFHYAKERMSFPYV